MNPDLLRARQLGFVLLRDRTVEDARLDPPLLRFNPDCSPEKLSAAIERLLPLSRKSV